MIDEFKECVKNKRIIKSPGIEKKRELEVEAAEGDLKDARALLGQKRFKYATIAGYYSLFHSARALLYQRGYRERGHYCLMIALKELYVKEKILDSRLLKLFEEAIGLREAADYESVFSKDGARRAIKGAEKFLSAAKEILKK